MNYMPPQGFPDPFPLMFSPPPDNDEGVVMTLWADMGNGQTVTLCFGPRTFATLASQATELCRQIGLEPTTYEERRNGSFASYGRKEP